MTTHDRGPDLHFGNDSASDITISEPIPGLVAADVSLMTALQELFNWVVEQENGTPRHVFTANAIVQTRYEFGFIGYSLLVNSFGPHVRFFYGDAVIS